MYVCKDYITSETYQIPMSAPTEVQTYGSES